MFHSYMFEFVPPMIRVMNESAIAKFAAVRSFVSVNPVTNKVINQISTKNKWSYLPFVNCATVLSCERFTAVPTGEVANVQMLSNMVVQKFSMHKSGRAVHDATFESLNKIPMSKYLQAKYLILTF